jgi:alkylhydroperoxidase family enzyme
MRVPPLPAEQWDEPVRAAFDGLLPADRFNPEGAGNALATLARHPALAKAFLQFNTHLLIDSTLPVQTRELAVLRVAHRCASAYEWTQHVVMARQAGLSAAQIAGAQNGEAANDFDRAVLDAVDELQGDWTVSDATWSALGQHLDERQRMDLIFTVGCYSTLAMAFNTFGVEVEAGAPLADEWKT